MARRNHIVKAVLLNNWGLKLLSLLLAALTFHAILGVTGYEVEYDVPLVVKVEPGVAVLNQDPATVRVRFRGSQEDLLHLDQKQIRTLVKPGASNPDGSEREVTVSAEDVKGAGGVTAVRVFPSVVKLTFDREIETTFAVAKPQTIGVPLMGKADLDYEPNAVRVRGPKRRLEELARSGNGQLTTEPVDVDGRVESFSKTVRIVPPADTWLSHIEPSEVMVKVGIVSRSATREWKNLPVLALTDTASAARYAIEPAGVNVTLEGRAEVLEKIEHAALAVFVNCTGVKGADAFDAPVVVHLPTPMDVVIKVEPPAVKVAVAAQP